MTRHLTLILGGARSGKSTYAEKLAREHQSPVLYVATAEAGDEEMAERIARHRAQRPADWITLEAPRTIGAVIRSSHVSAPVVLIDCLTLLANNLIVSLTSGYRSILMYILFLQLASAPRLWPSGITPLT